MPDKITLSTFQLFQMFPDQESAELHERLKIRAVQERTDMTKLLLRLLREYLEKPLIIRVP